MFEFKFTIHEDGDYPAAARIMGLLAQALRGASPESASSEYETVIATQGDNPVPAPATRKPRTKKTDADPIAGYNAIAEQMGSAQVPSAELIADAAKAASEVNEPAAESFEKLAGKVAKAPEKSRDELLAAVREIATAQGGLWLREMLATYKAARLSEVTNEQLAETLSRQDLLS